MTSPSSSSDVPPQAGPGGPGRLFHVKAALGGVGLLLGLVGMSLHQTPLVWGAVGCLGLAFVMRFVKPR